MSFFSINMKTSCRKNINSAVMKNAFLRFVSSETTRNELRVGREMNETNTKGEWEKPIKDCMQVPNATLRRIEMKLNFLSRCLALAGKLLKSKNIKLKSSHNFFTHFI